MLLSLALIFLCGMTGGGIFQKLKLPNLLGMLLTGIILGPYVLNLLDESLLAISTDLRQIALIVILMRAGLNINSKDLKKVGRPAFLMCCIPACFEITAMIIFAPLLLDISLLDAAIMGAVVAAVSPAVIVPRMLSLMESGYGSPKAIPQMIMAGASVDDVFVIVLFTAFIGFTHGGNASFMVLLTVPTSIGFGLAGGFFAGLVLTTLFAKTHFCDSTKVLITLSFSFFLVVIGDQITGVVGFSGLLAVMALGATIQQKNHGLASKLSSKFSKLWVGAEILLFVLVGATVPIQYALATSGVAVILIFLVLFFRILGVFVCLFKTPLNKKERLFTAFSYIPKATVQAAIGGLPLAMGLACGEIILTVAVLSILITAPLGAKLMDATYHKLLSK